MNPSPPLNGELSKKFPYNWAFSSGTLLPLFPNQFPSQFYPPPHLANSQNNSYPNPLSRAQFEQQLKPKIEKQQPIVKFQYVLSEEEVQCKQKPRNIEQPKSTLESTIYIHPLPVVAHKAKYFDPSAAPNLTSPSYNLVIRSNSKENAYFQACSTVQHHEQLQFPEEDKNPFIFFRHRRIKKKYRKYFKGKFCPDSQNSGNPFSQSEIDDQSADLLHAQKGQKKEDQVDKIQEDLKMIKRYNEREKDCEDQND